MTRSSSDLLYDLDPEIELTLRRLRKARNIVVSDSSNSVSSSDNSSPVTNISNSVEYTSTNNSAEQMENNNERTLKELATPNVMYQPWCIQRRSLQGLEGIPCGLLHNKTIGDTGRIHQDEGISILPRWSSKRLVLVLFNTWEDMKRISFRHPEPRPLGRKSVGSGNIMEKPCTNTRKDSTNYASHVHIIRSVNSLMMMDQSMIDSTSGGALMDKKSTTTRHLISNMASNAQQFGIRGASQSRMVNEIGVVDNLRLENQLTELTSLLRQLAVGQHQPSVVPRICGICTSMEHLTDMCSTLQENELDYPKSVGAIGGYQYGKQPYQSWKAAILARAEFRAISSLAIWTCPECTLKTNRLSTIDSTILSTTVPVTTTTENASSRKFTISGGPNEAIGNQQPGVPTNHEL
ncbi:hypothetical protein CR513_44718, partial [Mucuna pruriens]